MRSSSGDTTYRRYKTPEQGIGRSVEDLMGMEETISVTVMRDIIMHELVSRGADSEYDTPFWEVLRNAEVETYIDCSGSSILNVFSDIEKALSGQGLHLTHIVCGSRLEFFVRLGMRESDRFFGVEVLENREYNRNLVLFVGASNPLAPKMTLKKSYSYAI